MCQRGAQSRLAGAATFTTTTVSTIIEAVPTIVEIGAGITAIAKAVARTYFASDRNEEEQGEVKAKSTEDSDKSNDAKDRNKNPKPSHQDEESTSNNGHGRNEHSQYGRYSRGRK